MTKFSWNKGIDTCFNAKCVLLGRNFDFLGGYLVVTARYLLSRETMFCLHTFLESGAFQIGLCYSFLYT